MFEFLRRSPDEDDSPPLSVIGEGATARGAFDLKEGDLRVDGTIDGDVRTAGHVHVSQGGTVNGEIRAGSIRVSGDAEGVLCARQSLVVLGSSKVYGILCAEALTIKDGADFEGGICKSADRIPMLKAMFASTEEYTIPDSAASRSETTPDEPSQLPETAEQTETSGGRGGSFSENGDPPDPVQEAEAVTTSRAGPGASGNEDVVLEEETREVGDADGAESFSELKW